MLGISVDRVLLRIDTTFCSVKFCDMHLSVLCKSDVVEG